MCAARRAARRVRRDLRSGATLAPRARLLQASYNKPFSVTAWLEKVDVKEKWILMMDTDMLLRQLVDPVALGVRRGNVVSAEYTYLTGTTSGFAKRFIDESLHPRMAQARNSTSPRIVLAAPVTISEGPSRVPWPTGARGCCCTRLTAPPADLQGLSPTYHQP
jgi:hypothetical protein